MCVIIACPPGRFPKWDNIVDATWENPDGSGWVMQTPNGLEVFRSALDVDSVISSFWTARDAYPNGWAVWHSRLATSGGINDVNTHPFEIPGKPWALVHNGVLPLDDGPFRSDRSDSRILAEDHIANQSWKQLRRNEDAIENWLGNDKVVLISGRQERGGNVMILNEHIGKWDPFDQCWYSHPLYGWPMRRTASAPTAADLDEYDWEKQDMSDDIIRRHLDGETYVDDTGHTLCVYCDEVLDDCLCWDDIDDAEVVDDDDDSTWTADDEADYAALFDQAEARAIAKQSLGEPRYGGWTNTIDR
jgi:hypothetical protein